jgi:DedD protein
MTGADGVDMQLKQRLVGLAVLIALAVVVIPMLLRGPDDAGMFPDGLDVPANPDHDFTSRVDSESTPRPVIPETPARVVVDASSGAISNAPPADVTPPADAAPPMTLRSEMKPVDAPESAPPAGSGWVVQVGSFSQEANALALRDSLRAKGFAVFVERLSGAQGMAWRVRVGPEVERGRAESLRDRLQREQGIKGAMVQTYP